MWRSVKVCLFFSRTVIHTIIPRWSELSIRVCIHSWPNVWDAGDFKWSRRGRNVLVMAFIRLVIWLFGVGICSWMVEMFLSFVLRLPALITPLGYGLGWVFCKMVEIRGLHRCLSTWFLLHIQLKIACLPHLHSWVRIWSRFSATYQSLHLTFLSSWSCTKEEIIA